MIGSSVTSGDKKRLDIESNFGNDRIIRPSVSRAFGAPFRSGGLTFQNTLNQDAINNDRVNMSRLFKPFGLQTKNTTLDSIREENDRLLQNTSVTSNRSSNNVATVNRTFGLVPENVCSSSIQNNSRLIQDVRNNHSSFVPTSFGLEMKSLSTLRGIPLNENSKLSQDTSYRTITEQCHVSNTSRIIRPAFANTTISNRSQIRERCNSEVDNGEFRVPSIPRIIRGRNAISSTRIFSHQNIDRCSKNLSNVNGFDVSHIPGREIDSFSESRLGLMRSGWLDKHNTSGSVYSTSSVKAQVRNLLENLHFSILRMGPNIPVEAVTMEFDKAKQGLDNIPEMSFTASMREADVASVKSHVSKYNCSAVYDNSKSIINGECLNLKSGKEVLKSLAISKIGVENKLGKNQVKEISTLNTSENMELDVDQEKSGFVFKKPKGFRKQRKSSNTIKIRTPPVKKNLPSKIASKIINLKQWYPIAVGNDLALCGVDEQGVLARTEAVKKRVNNRKVELINGLSCILIGSPSKMALALPKNIASLLKNGLTSRWRVLQKELLNCQTTVEEKQKRKSKSPRAAKSSEKKDIPGEAEKSVKRRSIGKTQSPWKKAKSLREKEKPKKRKSNSPSKRSPVRLRSPKKAISDSIDSVIKSPRRLIKRTNSKVPLTSSPLKKAPSEEKICEKKQFRSGVKRVQDGCTRSGRNVKPPSQFWLVGASSDTPAMSFQKTQTEIYEVNRSKIVKSKKANAKVNQKTVNESHIVNLLVESKESCEKSKELGIRRTTGRPPKVRQEEKSRKKTPEVSYSTEVKIRNTRGKRKQEDVAEMESIKRKKSKIEDSEVEKEAVTYTKGTTNNRKRKIQIEKECSPPKTKAKPLKKKKEVKSKKKLKNSSASATETKIVREAEEDCEFQLDDIEIPQFGNLNGNTQLTRSQLRLVSAETPPLKYFNSNLKVFTSTTPMRTPEWFISQRTESEVKQFQKRRAEAFKKKIEVKKTATKKTIVTEKIQSRDLKKVMEWVAEKTVQSPVGNSQVLQYVLPSRRQLEQEEEEEEEENEEHESGFL